MSFTPSQRDAIAAEGNVIVVAGAGTGKTRTLVERCVRRVLAPDHKVSFENILVVTFNKAAAAEIRERTQQNLEQEAKKRPDDPWIAAQMELLDQAEISTLHSFCHRLIRQHFFLLDADPRARVMDNAEEAVLRSQVLDEYLEHTFGSADQSSENIRRLVLEYFNGDDQRLAGLIQQLHHHMQTRGDAEAWFAAQVRHFENPRASDWIERHQQALKAWSAKWSKLVPNLPPENCGAIPLARIFSDLNGGLISHLEALQQVRECHDDKVLWEGVITTQRNEMAIFDEAQILLSFCQSGGVMPLQEDWDRARGQMLALLEAARGFQVRYADRKRRDGLLDFHDLEQHAIRLLWDDTTNQPTPVAEELRRKFAYVFVDEYQDITPAQDRIIQCLGRSGAGANRFLVGDVKQSIYRFRQADPALFLGYEQAWSPPNNAGTKIYLSDNFRSHEDVLTVVNLLFGRIMRADFGGLAYDEKARLAFGAKERREHHARRPGEAPHVEFLLRQDDSDPSAEEAPGPDGAEDECGAEDAVDHDKEEQQARLIARRFQELFTAGTLVFDKQQGEERPVRYGDMVILMRAPRPRAEAFAKIFHQEGVPLQTGRAGFYESIEVLDLLHLLEILDNPLQDAPVIAVLRSPLVGLTLGELALVRRHRRRVHFWLALREAARTKTETPLGAKLNLFLAKWQRWRGMGRHLSILQRLEMILAETNYPQWLAGQDRANQRLANVRQLLEMARRFGRREGGGLYPFVRLLEQRQDVVGDEDATCVSESDSVRLLSIHGSKGLEFPVVAVAGLGSRFNYRDLNHDILIDDEDGLCPKIRLHESGQSYSSLARHCARQKLKERSQAEEMRLLYVAMTRAQDRLIMVGEMPGRPKPNDKSNTSKKTDEETHKWAASGLWGESTVANASSFLDWIGPWLVSVAPEILRDPTGSRECWSWRIGSERPASSPRHSEKAGRNRIDDFISPDQKSALREKILWLYPHENAVRQPAKTTVTLLRNASARIDADEAAVFDGNRQSNPPLITRKVPANKLSAQQIGQAHHLFLQHIHPSPDFSPALLVNERARMLQAGTLGTDEAACLDLPALAAFYQSPLGLELLQHWSDIRRETPFTARLGQGDLVGLQINVPNLPADDFVLVQGMADLVVVRPAELWIGDFKTDRGDPRELEEKLRAYSTQLRLYAFALGRIHGRPVTRIFLHFLHQNSTHYLEAVPPSTAPPVPKARQ